MNRREIIKALSIAPAISLADFHSFSNSPETIQTPQNIDSIPRFGDGRDWFFEKRFGMFIHWGLYSIPAWHEQHQYRLRVPRKEYEQLINQWNPVKFNPEQWLDLLQETGMEYITITTKHHDGFCLWDTKETSFNTMQSPYGKDIIGMLAEACHRRDIPLCLYYSIVDWHHPNYPNQGRHHETPGPEPGDQPDWDKYMEFLKAQVRELCTNYGEIHGFWWDMNVPEYQDPSINQMIRKLQPKAVINNRGFDDGDYGTPERDYFSDDAKTLQKPTEACQSVGMESWGYRKDEDYYSDLHLIRSIDRYLVRGANYLLNVGPTAEGIIPEPSRSILNRIGSWFHNVKESMYNVVQDTRPPWNDVYAARKGNYLYLHLNPGPTGSRLKLKPLKITPKSAVLLNTGQPVSYQVSLVPSEHGSQEAFLRIYDLPVNELCNTVPVIRLEFDRPVDEILAEV